MASLPENSTGMLALYEDRHGRIWATGPPSLVLHQTDTDKGDAFAIVNCPPTSKLGGFTEDAQGRIWVAPRNTRIWRVDGNTLVRDGPPPRALAASIRALLFDPEGALWIGTLGAGIYRWSSLGLQHYTTEDGLPNNSVLGLAVDGLGNLWITSHNGIIGCSRRQFANYVHGKSPPLLRQHLGLDEGLPDATCSGSGQPVIEQDSAGWFWAATMSGAAGFDPRGLPGPTGKVNIETLKLDGLAVRPADGEIRAPGDRVV